MFRTEELPKLNSNRMLSQAGTDSSDENLELKLPRLNGISSVTNFLRLFLFARVLAKICPNYLRQMCIC